MKSRVLSLVLKEREKMTKKILVAILLVCLCGSALGASNMKQKSFTPESNEHERKTQQEEEIEEKITLRREPQIQAAAAPITAEAETTVIVTNALDLYQNRWNIYLTSEEIDLLAKIVWVEACGEPEEGQEAVVEVIFNRMCSPDYPNTLYEVLSQDHPVQFCSWKLRDTAKPTEKEYQSIYRVLYGQTEILRSDTVYFSTFALTPNVDKKICCHCFCYGR